MLISYENQRIEKLFSDFSKMTAKIGPDIARTLKKRRDQLSASPNFESYLKLGLGKPHSLSNNLEGCYGISLSGNVRLIVHPDSADTSPEALAECEHVIVIGVSDYHGGKENWIIP